MNTAPMKYAQAAELVGQLPRVLIPSDPTKVREVFDALVCVDGRRIAQRAALFFQDFAPGYRDSDLAGDDLAHRLTMDIFQDSMVGYLQEKPADVERSVEHDVATWIEANAALVAEANLALMEDALATDSAHARNDRIDLRQNVDFDACEAEQRRVLQETWDGIDAAVTAFLSTGLQR